MAGVGAEYWLRMTEERACILAALHRQPAHTAEQGARAAWIMWQQQAKWAMGVLAAAPQFCI